MQGHGGRSSGLDVLRLTLVGQGRVVLDDLAARTGLPVVARFAEAFPKGFADPAYAGDASDKRGRAPRWRRAQAAQDPVGPDVEGQAAEEDCGPGEEARAAEPGGGIGGEVAAIIAENAFEYLDAPVMRVGMKDTHNAFAGPMEEYILPNTAKVLEAARRLAGY